MAHEAIRAVYLLVNGRRDGRDASSERSLRGRVHMTSSTSKSTKRKSTTRGTKSRRWSARVSAESNALDLDKAVFTWQDPRKIARSLKRSAERSRRRKSEPYRSAMSMLTFYMNRAGNNLGARQRRVLERAKKELRHAFAKD
jgi:putative cell wall-binding protein